MKNKPNKPQGKNKLPSLPEQPIPAGAVTWLMFSLAVSIGWHIPHTPIWALVGAVVIGAFIYPRIIKGKPLPSKFVRIGLTVAALAGIVLTYRSYMGRDPGMTALIIFAIMKLMEFKNRRDFMVTIFICYFLVFGNFLYDQSIEDLAFTLVATILITAALLRLNHPSGERVKLSYFFRFSLRLTIYALPFTVMLFFLFPRSSGPLWNLSQDAANRFRSGFNDVIQPGQIAQLAQSKIPAFKVEFPNGPAPALQDLYFRGLVLWVTDGKRWYQGILPSRYFRPKSYDQEGILQTITLEPHNRRWLFGLDWPVVVPRWSRILPGGIFQTIRSVKGHYRYQVLSRFGPGHSPDLSERHRRWSLQLPTKNSQRIIQLGRQWRQESQTEEDILRRAEQFFKDSSFVYTLHPGLLDEDEPMEDFLFKERRGFCEHYASAFTMLVRAAGIPARVVLGYQGGEFNDIGNYLLVRQSEAHAWSEVWLEGEGWRRVDPTAWVSPVRIQYGVDVSQSVSSGELAGTEQSEAIEKALEKNIFEKIFKWFKNHWDNINYKWDVWIISYNRSRQRDFFKNLGFGGINGLTLFLAVLVIVPLFFFIISYMLKRQTLTTDPLLKLYQRFCLKLGKAGINRMRWEGPVHFQRRASEQIPEKAEMIRKVTDLFVHLRYGRMEVSKSRLKQLKHYIRQL
ncbi:MAG: DUF3488 domain-containing transglutaminase family protein [bacterium]|nr:DUF3488 domain-containing transglutaminase family protein [bacterium]